MHPLRWCGRRLCSYFKKLIKKVQCVISFFTVKREDWVTIHPVTLALHLLPNTLQYKRNDVEHVIGLL